MNQRRPSADRPLPALGARTAVPAVSPLSPAIPIPRQPFALRQIRRSTFRPDPAQLPHPPPHALILTGLQTAYPAAHQHRRRPQQNSDIHLAQTRGSLQPPGRDPARRISPRSPSPFGQRSSQLSCHLADLGHRLADRTLLRCAQREACALLGPPQLVGVPALGALLAAGLHLRDVGPVGIHIAVQVQQLTRREPVRCRFERVPAIDS
jgi:hypothetical protein